MNKTKYLTTGISIQMNLYCQGMVEKISRTSLLVTLQPSEVTVRIGDTGGLGQIKQEVYVGREGASVSSKFPFFSVLTAISDG